jgi:Porin PorA
MLRRMAGPALVGAGIFLIVLAVLLPTVVYPRLAVLPLDPRALQTAHGTGFTVFLPRSVADGGLRLYRNVGVTSKVWVTEDRSASGPRPKDSPNVNWRVATTTSVDDVGLLQVTVEGISLDRHTALATNCCRDYIITDKGDLVGQPMEHHGYVFMFPFGVRKKDYPLWDANISNTAPAKYAGEDRRRGLKVYRFVQTVPDQKTGTQELPGEVLGLPDASVVADAMYRTRRTYWVEPNSGAIVDYTESMDRRFVYQGRVLPVIQGTLSLEHGSGSDATFKLIKTAAVGLPLVRRTLPAVFVPLGLLCLAAGVVLMVRAGRRSEGPYDDGDVRMLDEDPWDPWQRDETRHGERQGSWTTA